MTIRTNKYNIWKNKKGEDIMNKNKKLSIIVPVYNAEEYMEKCLDRLLEQSYKNIEIIIVNDCSQGNC